MGGLLGGEAKGMLAPLSNYFFAEGEGGWPPSSYPYAADATTAWFFSS